jgi:hypothetical protein
VNRSENIVRAAIAVLQAPDTDDAGVDAAGIASGDPIADLPQLEGIGTAQYQRLLAARNDAGPGSAAPPVSKRLSLQHFFPRYLHLAASGWILQPRQKELQRVYGLVKLPASGRIRNARAQARLFRSLSDWQGQLRQWLQQLRDTGGNVLLISPDDDSLQQLHEALGVEWEGVLQRPLEGDTASVVGGLFLSLTIDQALKLNSSQITASNYSVVFAGTPGTMLDEALVCHRYAPAGDAVLFASLQDKALMSGGAILKLVCPTNRLAYNSLRRRLEPGERKGREQVAAHDAYMRQTLAFSGDTL